VAWGSREEGVDALIVMWQDASPLKIEATRGYGASVDTSPSDPTTAFAHLDVLQAETGRTLIHPFNDPAVIAGQGTVGLEILEDAPEADVVLVPCGGGGLVTGIAVAVKALRPSARVIAVEPLRHHPGHQIGELLVPAGRRQSGAPDVVPDIEVRVLHPDRSSEAERHRAKLVAVARDPRQAPGQVSQKFLMGRCWSLEHRDRGDRHRYVRVSVLRIDKHGVQRVQPVHDGLLTRPRRARRMLEKSSLTSMVGRAAPAGPGPSSWPTGTFGSRR